MTRYTGTITRFLLLGLLTVTALGAAPRRVIFLHTNDQHGHFYGKLENGERPRDGYALENLITYIETIRHEMGKDADIVVTYGGDLNTGTPESAFFLAAPDIELWRLAGLNVAVIGNHEFDNAPDVFEKQIAAAGFPWISANLERKAGGRLTKPHHIITGSGIKIGVVGLTTEQTNHIGNPQYTKQYRFADTVATARSQARELRPQTDFIVALTHLGLYAKGAVPFSVADDRVVVESVPEINLILGGHSHTLIDGQVVNGVRIFQAKCFSAHLVRADFEIDPRGKDGKAAFRFVSSQVLDLRRSPSALAAPVAEKRAKARQIIDNYLKKSAEKFSEIVADAEEDFHYEREHALTAAITKLVAESQLDESGAEIALVIAGGIRGGFKKGKITLRDVLTVLPFGNTVGIVEISGSELITLLEKRILHSTDKGGYPVVAGLGIQINAETKTLSVTFAGKPLDPNRKYKVSLNSYIGSGGTGYPDYISQGKFSDLNMTDAMLLTKYLKKKGKIHRDMLRLK